MAQETSWSEPADVVALKLRVKVNARLQAFTLLTCNPLKGDLHTPILFAKTARTASLNPIFLGHTLVRGTISASEI